MKMKQAVLGLGTLAMALMALPSQALSLSDFTVVPEPVYFVDFSLITANNPDVSESEGIGAGLGVGLSYDDTLDLLLFQFVNVAPDGVISEIYFDDNSGLLGAISIYDESDPGVDFHLNGTGPDKVNPGDLPSGGSVGFEADIAFSSESENPQPANGIGTGERLTLAFAGATGDPATDAGNVIDAIINQQLRIGLHVISIGAYSEGYVNNTDIPSTPQDPQDPVPEPTTLLLLGMGSSFLFLRKRHFA